MFPRQRAAFVSKSHYFLKSLYFFFQWHLGFFQTDYTPTKRGFDSFFGYYCGKEDYWDHSNREVDGWGLDLRNGTEVRKNSGPW